MASTLHPDWLDDHPTLGRIWARNPELAEELRTLWPPELATECGGFLELIVLAHHAGILSSTDGPGLVEAIAGAIATVPNDTRRLSLRSETDQDRRAVVSRLAQLRRSKVRRERYVTLVGRTWEAIRDDWEASGRPSVEHAVRSRRRELEAGASWQDVADKFCFSDNLSSMVGSMGANVRLVVVPAYYTHKGMWVELNGTVVVGVRSEGDSAVARARTERLARLLKTVSDPTRLAILDTLRRGPRSVTELAEAFSLAQPTVSNHVKVLRDAGLVVDTREGRRRRLMVNTDEIDRMVCGLQDVLAVTAEPGPAAGAAPQA